MSAIPKADPTVIEAALRAALAPDLVEVKDDSAAHAGHAGASSGGHYRVHIISARFAGLTRIARHRLVYDALAPLMDRGIHALVIDARLPGDAASDV